MTQDDYIYSQICHIHCGSQNGIGFLVSPNQIVTAEHVLFDAEKNNTPIQIRFEPNENTWEYTLWKSNIYTIHSCSFLTLPESRPFRPLLLRASTDNTEITASAYILWLDAPTPRDSYPLKYVAQSNVYPDYDYQANITLEPGVNSLSTYSGFSGAPIIVGNCIDGLLTDETTDKQSAVRVYGIVGTAFQRILTDAKIPFILHKENPNNPCLFAPDRYIEYLQTCMNENTWFPLDSKNVYWQDTLLFSELEHFVSDNWIRRLLANVKPDTKEFKLLNSFLDEIGIYISMSKIASFLILKYEATLTRKAPNVFPLISIKEKLESPHYNNCMFISGYFGSGKTSFAIEAAKHMWKLRHDEFTPVFLIVSPTVPDNLHTSLVNAFTELLGSKHTLTEFLDAFANHTLVIVLDDVHEYFQSGIDMKYLRDVIRKNSRIYVKWIIMLQTGSGKDFQDQYRSYFTNYTYKWRAELSDSLVGQWFQLDDWYRKQDLPQRILWRQQPCNSPDWIWKESVSSTNYYNPLLINVLIVYAQQNDDWSFLSYNNFLFPAFCDTFFRLLARGSQSIMIDAEIIANHLRTIHSLRFRLSSCGINRQQINALINHGLLMDTNKTPTIYKSIPDIIWYYLIAVDMNERFALNGSNFRNTLQTIYWTENPKDFENILSILVLSEENSADDVVRIWNTLFDCGFEQVALDSGFKCDALLRNKLIHITLEHKQLLRNHFPLFMRLCSLGKIEKILFHNMIDVCVQQCEHQLKNNNDLFAYMLLQNYYHMSWENILETLSHLSPILSIGASDDFLCRLGRDLGRTVAQKASLAKQLDKAIQKAFKACNSSESNRKYYIQNNEYRKYPIDLFDGFCSDFCNYIIQKHGIRGYHKFDAAGWYSYDKKNTPNQYRRNLALTFALAHQYRYSRQHHRKEDAYVNWYETELVKDLSKGTIGQKKFALYLIIHSELRENHYRIERGGNLWKTADELRRDRSMRNILEGKTCRVFYKYNFDN